MSTASLQISHLAKAERALREGITSYGAGYGGRFCIVDRSLQASLSTSGRDNIDLAMATLAHAQESEGQSRIRRCTPLDIDFDRLVTVYAWRLLSSADVLLVQALLRK